jgi:glycosyltransferase involved in cell wall biosynthesis
MMPSQDFLPAAAPVAPGRPAKDQPVRIVFPTHAEPGRGFDFLRPWAEELAKNGSWKGRIQLTVRQYAPWRKDLRPVPRSNDVVRWVEGDLSDPAYQDLLESCDVVLLPYSAVDFHYRTSSILAEAFSLGKPVICVEGSWLADQVRAVKGGWVLPELSKPALLQALQDVHRARDEIRPWPGRPAMDRWLAENSVESFFSGIVGDAPVNGRLDLGKFLTWLWKPVP